VSLTTPEGAVKPFLIHCFCKVEGWHTANLTITGAGDSMKM
jgi:hypothetical protein